ncbi:MAG: hypothetical protein AABX96_02165 [Nanoarchaeota archaeon]
MYSGSSSTSDTWVVDQPGNLINISDAIIKLLGKGFDYIIFDSLTDLLAYENKFYCIDFTTSLIFARPQKQKQCTFMSIEPDFKRLQIEIQKAVANGYTIVILDSLSTFLQLNEFSVDTRAFIKAIIGVLAEYDGKMITSCYAKDREFIVELKIHTLFGNYVSQVVPLGLGE